MLTAALFVAVVPAAMAQPFLERLENELDRLTDGARPAEPGYLGIVADERGEKGRGVRILTVRAGSPAEKAGLAPGDLLTMIDRRRVTSLADMTDILGKTRPGDRVGLTVERDGARVSMIASLISKLAYASRAPAEKGDRSDDLPPPPADHSLLVKPERAVLGIRVLPLTEETRRALRLVVRNGVVIQTVTDGSAAEAAGLPVGGVIVVVDGRRIDDPDDLTAVIGRAKPGQEIVVTYYHGPTLKRTKVRLGSSKIPMPPAPPEEDEELRLVGPDAGRTAPKRDDAGRIEIPGAPDEPALRKVERILDGVLGPPDAPTRAESDAHVAALNKEIERLRAEVDKLQRRVAELEKLLKDSRKSP